MIDTYGIYIFDKKGDTFYIQERYVQGSRDPGDVFNSNVFQEVQKYITTNAVVTLGNSKLYIEKDEALMMLFVIKTDLNARDKKIFKIMNEIKDLFKTIFDGKLNTQKIERIELLIKFQDKLERIIDINSV